jgi:hypothetical protein
LEALGGRLVQCVLHQLLLLRLLGGLGVFGFFDCLFGGSEHILTVSLFIAKNRIRSS